MVKNINGTEVGSMNFEDAQQCIVLDGSDQVSQSLVELVKDTVYDFDSIPASISKISTHLGEA